MQVKSSVMTENEEEVMKSLLVSDASAADVFLNWTLPPGPALRSLSGTWPTQSVIHRVVETSSEDENVTKQQES